MRYSDCEALKFAASFSSCRPSSPDIACHHMMSVTASAGEAKPIATAATARHKNRRAVFTIEAFQSSAAERPVRTAYAPPSLAVTLTHQGGPQRTIDHGYGPGRMAYLPPAAKKR